MSRRLDKTLADYIGIAISPVLIMTMVGSLVFFLLEVFYRGQYSGRLQVIMALFVMAIVLIGRISIEMGTEHAALYATPLALVTALALARLVDHGWFINVGLLGLVWWSAHKLTWDCTLIDESEDASGEGLLQSIGLGKLLAKRKDAPPPASEPDEPADRQDSPAQETSSGDSEQHPNKIDKPDKRKPHSPGVWIVYFSLAALPLFGLGEIFLRNHPDRKRYAFSLLLLYVASGLGLLLTTSFLGLRRYLRQRRLQMPASMAGSWIAFGVVILLVLLVLAAMLPRPGTDRSPFESPVVLRSPDRKASRVALGHDSAEGPGAPRGEQPEDAQKQQSSPSGDGGQQQTPQPGNAGNQSNKASQQTGGQQQSSSGQASSRQSSQQGDQQSKDQSQANQADRGSRQQPERTESGDRSSKAGSQSRPSDGGQARLKPDSETKDASQDRSKEEPQDQRATSSQQGEDRADQERATDRAQQQSQQSASSESSSSWSMPEFSLGLSSGWLMALLRWILYIVLAVVGLIWLWRSRRQVATAILGLLRAIRNFWASLFGGRSGLAEKAEAAQVTVTPLPRFAAFSDPFADGTAARLGPEELVRYTFQAMEAWARERGRVRPPEQTAFEFAQSVTACAPALAMGARRLAELYSQAAYAPGTIDARQVAMLEELWHQMRAAAAPTTQPST